MKRQFSLTAALLVLILVLSACGGGTRKEQQTDDRDSDDPITDSAVSDPAGTAGREPSRQEDGMLSGGNPADGDANAGGETRQEGQTSAESGASGGDSNPRDDAGGVPLDQMLRNARVHDRDGDLLDSENSVTPGADRW